MDNDLRMIKSSLSPRKDYAVPISFRVLEQPKDETSFRLPTVEDFEVDPISPKHYLEDLQSRGLSFWPCIWDSLEQIFSGPLYAPKYRCVVVLGGIGSAKSTQFEVVYGFLADWLLRLKSPMKAMGKREIDQIAMINMAPNEDKAKDILFRKFKAHVEQNARLANMPKRTVQRLLEFPSKRVVFSSGNSSAAFPQGADIFAAVIDECTSFVTQRGDPVADLYKAIEQRRESRFGPYGMVAMIGEGGRENCFAEELMAEAKTDSTIFALRRSRYDANPVYFSRPRFEFTFPFTDAKGNVSDITLRPPVEFQERYVKDRVDALRTLDGYPAAAGRPFFNSDEIAKHIDRSRPDPAPDPGNNAEYLPLGLRDILPGWFRGNPSYLYALACDLGSGQVMSGRCAAGLAIAHLDPSNQVVYLDLAVRFMAKAPNIVNPADVRSLIMWFHKERGFTFGSLTYDQWASGESIAELQRLGYPAERFSVNYDEYTQFKLALYGGRVNIFPDRELELEMRGLEDYGGGGRSSSSKVYPGLGLFKDELDAVVGAVVRCLCGKLEAPPAPPPAIPRGALVLRGGGGGGLPPQLLEQIPRPPAFQNPTPPVPGFRSGVPRYRSAVTSPRWRQT